ncbi:hypothetical protein Nepgr_008708 [Nepenthes gracilis]|uniref:Uncharacterized protein n=1 Tax=Nepenthes gracilis TaxID=150966 RepID=A0AAD3XJI2_NEPGR|nr:hypothetical protein Nepgr_008708 [Nepenthes gracilis]
MNRCMFDGIGAMEFVSPWGETARDLSVNMLPSLDRLVLKARIPPKIEFKQHEFAEVEVHQALVTHAMKKKCSTSPPSIPRVLRS